MTVLTDRPSLTAASPAATPVWPARRVAWWGLTMLVACYALAILDRVGMGLLVQPIEASLHISDTQMGLLQGAGFALFFAVLGLPAGLLADRANRRTLVAAGVAAWSLATMACGLATGFTGLFLARIGVGAGEATLSPAGTSMIGDYFRPQSRSRAFGIYGLGGTLGVGTAFLLTGGALQFADLIAHHGPRLLSSLPRWKLVFMIFGAPGLLMAALFALTVKEPARQEGGRLTGPMSLAPLGRRLRLHRLIYVALIGAAVANAVSTYAIIGWFPTFMIRTYGWSAKATAGAMGVFGLPCGIFSCLAAGWVVSEFERRNRRDAPILVAAIALMCIAAGALVGAFSPSAEGSMLGYVIMGTAMNFPFIALLTGLNRVTPNALRGQILAVLGIATNLVSQTASPLTVGYLSDHVFGHARGLGFSLFAVITVVCSLATLGLLAAKTSYLLASEDLVA